jgi:hypothetical protein
VSGASPLGDVRRTGPGPGSDPTPWVRARPRWASHDLGRSPWTTGDALRRRVCGTRPPLGVRPAHHHADQLRRRGVLASAYGCVFCGHWHVGPALSMDTIEALARVIRGLES